MQFFGFYMRFFPPSAGEERLVKLRHFGSGKKTLVVGIQGKGKVPEYFRIEILAKNSKKSKLTTIFFYSVIAQKSQKFSAEIKISDKGAHFSIFFKIPKTPRLRIRLPALRYINALGLKLTAMFERISSPFVTPKVACPSVKNTITG
jgi:hypothetical protein